MISDADNESTGLYVVSFSCFVSLFACAGLFFCSFLLFFRPSSPSSPAKSSPTHRLSASSVSVFALLASHKLMFSCPSLSFWILFSLLLVLHQLVLLQRLIAAFAFSWLCMCLCVAFLSSSIQSVLIVCVCCSISVVFWLVSWFLHLDGLGLGFWDSPCWILQEVSWQK